MSVVRKIRLRLRDGDYCAICSLRMIFSKYHSQEFKGLTATVDHIIEKRNNGPNKLDNLRLVHEWCNGGRVDYTPRQLRRRVYGYWRKHFGLKSLLRDANIVPKNSKFKLQLLITEKVETTKTS